MVRELIVKNDIRREALALAGLYRAAARGVSLFQPACDIGPRIAARFGVLVYDIHATAPPGNPRACLAKSVLLALLRGLNPEAAVLYGLAWHYHGQGKAEEDLFKPIIGRPDVLKYWLRCMAECCIFRLWPWPKKGSPETCPAQN